MDVSINAGTLQPSKNERFNCESTNLELITGYSWHTVHSQPGTNYQLFDNH